MADVDKRLTTQDVALYKRVSVPSGTTSLNAENSRYYYFNGTVNNLSITFPYPRTGGYGGDMFFYFTTGNSPSLSFTSQLGNVRYYDSFSIVANTTYEVCAVANGGGVWIVSSAKIA